jgi:hypothetical protein
MGTFTVTVQELIDLESYKYTTGNAAHQAMGLNLYPIFDEAYRAVLNEKIIAHYNEQEIGHETVSMFRYAMARKMNEVMPLFNQHYRASQIEIDPLLTINIANVATGTESSTTESESTAGGRVVASNTPQVRLSGQGDYATSAQDSNSKTVADGTANNETNTDNTSTGYTGNPAELVYQMRQTFINIDLMVIDQLTELFMMVWDNGEEFTRGNNDYFSFYPFYG